MITVTRYHDICTGHRVLNHEGKCAKLHGHNYRIYFTVAGDLDSLGRVIDFSKIKDTLCEWLENHWDHKTLLKFNDPLTDVLTESDGIVIVDFNPTAENMAQFLLHRICPAMLIGTGLRVVSIRIDETAKCSAEVTL